MARYDLLEVSERQYFFHNLRIFHSFLMASQPVRRLLWLQMFFKFSIAEGSFTGLRWHFTDFLWLMGFVQVFYNLRAFYWPPMVIGQFTDLLWLEGLLQVLHALRNFYRFLQLENLLQFFYGQDTFPRSTMVRAYSSIPRGPFYESFMTR